MSSMDLIPIDSETLRETLAFVQSIANALPIDRDTTKTCYAITNNHRDAAHSLLDPLRRAIYNAQP